MGMLRVREGKTDEAHKSLERAAAANSQNYLIHYYYAYALSREGAVGSELVSTFTPGPAAKIREEFRKAIELRPDFPESYNLLAFVSLVTGTQLDESIAMLKAAQRSPTADGAHRSFPVGRRVLPRRAARRHGGAHAHDPARHEARRRQQNFLAAVSHEFKSPLASIQLASETLVLRSRESDTQRLGRRILEDCERLLRMVDNLLDATPSRRRSPTARPDRARAARRGGDRRTSHQESSRRLLSAMEHTPEGFWVPRYDCLAAA